MPSDPREDIAREQGAFLDRLRGSSEPGGFDGRAVRIAGHALAHKRARSAAKAWPRLSASLGDEYGRLFAAYCAEHPWPPPGGPHADGWLFGAHLVEHDRMPDDGAIERAAVRLRMGWDARGGRLVLRRLGGIVLARLPRSGRCLIAVRVFRWERWWNLPVPRPRAVTAHG